MTGDVASTAVTTVSTEDKLNGVKCFLRLNIKSIGFAFMLAASSASHTSTTDDTAVALLESLGASGTTGGTTDGTTDIIILITMFRNNI